MANFYSNSDRGYSLVLEVTQTGQSKSANQSTVRSRLILRNTTVTFAQYTVTGSMIINGTTYSYSGQPSMLSNYSSIVLLDKTQTVTHNSNGEKSINVSASIKGSGGYSPGSLSTGTKSFGLTPIPRVSSVSANNVAMGSNMTITINANDTNFTHNLRYSFGSSSGTIATGVKGTYSWFVPMTLAEQLPNATTGRGTLVCETYSGSSKIGESQYSFTLTIPDNIKPSIVMIDVVETQTTVNNLNLGANTFVQIMSLPQVLFRSANGVYGSTITGYRAEVVGKNQSTTNPNGLLGMMNYSGSITIRASVIDSRGRTSNIVDKTITVLPYFSPVLSFTATRSGAQNTTLTINRNAKIAPLTVGGVQKNKMILTFKTAPLGSPTYTTNISNASGTYDTVSTFVNSPANLSGTYSATSSFEVLGVLEDSFTRTEFKVTVGTESVTYSYDKYGVGIMKIRERGALDVNGNIYANDNPIQQHQLTSNDGYIVNDYYGDFNNNAKTGTYHKGVQNGTATPNAPSDKWGILQVYSANNGSQILQIYTERDLPRRTFMRLRSNSVWYGWEEYAKANHPNLINTGWVGTGVDGVTAKRIGDMVYVNINSVMLTKNTGYHLGTLPENMRPNFELMFEAAVWVINSETVKIQINTGGSFAVIGSTVSQSRKLTAQFSFAI